VAPYDEEDRRVDKSINGFGFEYVEQKKKLSLK
jgi:hypothetical protein